MNTAEKALLNKLEAQNIDLNERLKVLESGSTVNINELKAREQIVLKLLNTDIDREKIIKQADSLVKYILNGK